MCGDEIMISKRSQYSDYRLTQPIDFFFTNSERVNCTGYIVSNGRISGSHSGENEDGCFLGCSAMLSGRWWYTVLQPRRQPSSNGRIIVNDERR
jgi:hypothetical protein